MDNKEEIFLSVLENHKGIIYKVANAYCNDPLDIDDLVQEIVLQIWTSLENFNSSYKWSTWIYRISLNTSISFYRKNKNRKEKNVRLITLKQIPEEEEESSVDDNFTLLREFIKDLKGIDKAIMLMYLEQVSAKEIAQVICTSQTNVTTKISRIKKKLKLRFENHKKSTYGE